MDLLGGANRSNCRSVQRRQRGGTLSASPFPRVCWKPSTVSLEAARREPAKGEVALVARIQASSRLLISGRVRNLCLSRRRLSSCAQLAHPQATLPGPFSRCSSSPHSSEKTIGAQADSGESLRPPGCPSVPSPFFSPPVSVDFSPVSAPFPVAFPPLRASSQRRPQRGRGRGLCVGSLGEFRSSFLSKP